MIPVYLAGCKCGEHRGSKLPYKCPDCKADLHAKQIGSSLKAQPYTGPSGRVSAWRPPGNKTPPVVETAPAPKPRAVAIVARRKPMSREEVLTVAIQAATPYAKDVVAMTSALTLALALRGKEARTHCKAGHELTPDNVYQTRRQQFRCVRCRDKKRSEMKALWKLFKKQRGAK